MKEQLKKYILENLKNITLLLILYLFGIIIGFLIYGFLSLDSKNELMSGIVETTNLVNNEGYEEIHIIKNGMQVNAIIFFILIMSCFTVITFGIISALMLFKGVSLSIYICILFSLFGPVKGVLAMICVAIIPNIIIILTYIFVGNESYLISKELLFKFNNKKIMQGIIKITSICVMSLPFVVLSLWLEQIFFRLVIGG